tara:strand:+ start:69046 stop:70749 length:1704 start_codon:yes stop_codon:yes gene_type:complete
LPILSEEEKLQLCLERDRLLCDPEFARSPTMSKLLHFLVDYKLQGERKPLTAYAIAVDALDRDDGFDTQIDSYPRVQIGRLRRMLDHFYLRENGEKRLSIPFHNYEIVLGPNEPIETTAHLLGNPRPDIEKPLGSPSGTAVASTKTADVKTGLASRFLSVVRDYIWVFIIVAMLAAIGVFFYSRQTAPTTETTISYPAIIVEGAENITRSSSRAKTQMTHSYLIGALKRFDQLRVVDEDIDGQNGAEYLLESSIYNASADRIQLRLVDNATREVIWSSPIEVGTIEALEADLDQAVVAIASPHGKIAQQELSKYRGDYSPGYPCLLQFHQFMRYRDKELLTPALQCMEVSAKQFPNDSYLMSMLVVAKNLSEQFGGPHDIDGISRDFALKAAKLDNDSASATFAVAQSAFFEGDCRRGVAWGGRAVRLNPLNSRIMGYLGLYMLACRMPEGEAYSTRALQMDPDADLVVAATLAMQKFRRGDAKAAQRLSSQYMDSAPGTTPGLEISYILSTAMLGDKDEARRTWRSLAERSGLSESAPPREVLSKWMSNPLLISELEADLVKAELY